MGYIPSTSAVSLPASDPESLPPVAVDGVLACDLLDCGTDLLLLAIPLFPLLAGMLLVPLLTSDQPSGGGSGPGLLLPRVTCPEGPFDAYCAPLDTGDHPLVSNGLPGFPYRMTS